MKCEFKYIGKIGDKKKQMYVAKLENWNKKQQIMKRKSELGGKKFYIDYDMTKKERIQQLVQIVKIEKNNEKDRVSKNIY